MGSGDTPLDVDNEESATINLSTMNNLHAGALPWHLSFSYGKALQKTCIVTWMGSKDNNALLNRPFLIERRQTVKQPRASTPLDLARQLVPTEISKELLARTNVPSCRKPSSN